MITTKAEYSEVCVSIRKHIADNGYNIKLASVRETLAKAFEFNSASALLAGLPVEFNPKYHANLQKLLSSNYRIELPLEPCSFPYPESIALSRQEVGYAWLDIKSRFLADLQNNPQELLGTIYQLATTTIMLEDVPTGLRPDGNGGWYCNNHNELSERIKNIDISPRLIMEPVKYSSKLVWGIIELLEPALISYWNDESTWLITSAAGNVCKAAVQDENGNIVDSSKYLDLPFYQLVEDQFSSKSNSYNRYDTFMNVSMHSRDTLGSFLMESLTQGAIGHCILNEIGRDFDYETMLWNPLKTLNHEPEELSRFSRFEHHRDFLYLDEFKDGICSLGIKWLQSQDDWSKTLRSLALRDFKEPEPLEHPYFRLSTGEFHKHHTDGKNLTTFINPYGRGEEEFGYHDYVKDTFEKKTLNDFLEYNESELLNGLKEEVENGELEQDSLMDTFNSIIEEDKDCAEQLHDEYLAALPFVKPFRLEQFTIERMAEGNNTAFVADGKYFSDLNETADIGYHYNTLDAMSRELCNISTFVKEDCDNFFGDSDLFYITEFVLRKGATPKSIAVDIHDGVLLAGRLPSACHVVVASEALTDSYFIGAPYDGCKHLNDTYKAFVNELIDELLTLFGCADYQEPES